MTIICSYFEHEKEKKMLLYILKVGPIEHKLMYFKNLTYYLVTISLLVIQNSFGILIRQKSKLFFGRFLSKSDWNKNAFLLHHWLHHIMTMSGFFFQYNQYSVHPAEIYRHREACGPVVCCVCSAEVKRFVVHRWTSLKIIMYFNLY